VPVVLFVLLRFIVPQFVSAIENVVTIVTVNEDKIGAFIESTGLQSDFFLQKLHELGAWIRSNITAIAGTAFSTAMNMFSSVADVVLAVILAIYILADKKNIRRRAFNTARAFLPKKLSDFVARCTGMFLSTFRTFLALQCLEALILGALILVCMLIFRIPYSVTIACMTALLALIPYVGAYLSLAIGCVLVITISPMKALIFVIIFLVAQQLEGNVIYPKVVGQSIGLPAYVTLAAVMVGGAIAGIPGMFFVIPIASVAYDLLAEAVRSRNAEKDRMKQA
jgi:predicted PurR-regulated permease PerM